MGTIAEHLILLEFYQRNGHQREFQGEAYLLCSTHLQELLATQSGDAIHGARCYLSSLREKYKLADISDNLAGSEGAAAPAPLSEKEQP